MKNIIILNELKKIRELLYLFKNDLPSLKDGRVEIDAYSEKLHKYGCVCVYVYDDAIKGFAAFYANDSIYKKAYLSMIAVKENYRRENIGSKMIEFVEKDVARKNMLTLNLEVNKQNGIAIKFYERHGYRMYNETDDSYYMRKEVGSYEKQNQCNTFLDAWI